MNPFAKYSSELIALENILNQEKDRLSLPGFEQLKKDDPAEQYLRETIRQINQKFNGQRVTKAWLKLAEILFQPNVNSAIKSLASNSELTAFFNAELPGGFVLAVNHLTANWGISLDWLISSYLPRPGGLIKSHLPDQFGLINSNPKRSLVGFVETNLGKFYSDGDLTHPKVPSILAELATNTMGKPIKLYTADGGFSVAGKENQQESLTLPLILGEVETGLKVLGSKGVFILKVFTFFTPTLLTLLGSLATFFDQYAIFKPSSSGALNSESYFIGIGYNGAPPDFIAEVQKAKINLNEQLVQGQITNYPLLMVTTGIPEAIQTNILAHLNGLVQQQIGSIRQFLNKQPMNFAKLDLILQQITPLPSNRQLALNSRV